MPVDAGLQETKFPPTRPYLVGREKIREFATAVSATHPLYTDLDAARAAGYQDLIAPPTFPVVLQQVALDQLLATPDTGMDFTRIVHGEQRFEYSRAIIAGDELVAQLVITSIKVLGLTSMVTAETVITDVKGHHVATAVSTLVQRDDEVKEG